MAESIKWVSTTELDFLIVDRGRHNRRLQALRDPLHQGGQPLAALKPAAWPLAQAQRKL
jgi:hypothetical protein